MEAITIVTGQPAFSLGSSFQNLNCHKLDQDSKVAKTPSKLMCSSHIISGKVSNI